MEWMDEDNFLSQGGHWLSYKSVGSLRLTKGERMMVRSWAQSPISAVVCTDSFTYRVQHFSQSIAPKDLRPVNVTYNFWLSEGNWQIQGIQQRYCKTPRRVCCTDPCFVRTVTPCAGRTRERTKPVFHVHLPSVRLASGRIAAPGLINK